MALFGARCTAIRLISSWAAAAGNCLAISGLLITNHEPMELLLFISSHACCSRKAKVSPRDSSPGVLTGASAQLLSHLLNAR